MALYFVTAILGLICLTTLSYAGPISDEDIAELYLQQFDHPEGNGPGNLPELEVLAHVLKVHQQFVGKNETGPPPDLCEDATLDTVTRTRDGSTYVFKGEWYWKVIYNVTAQGYPKRISDDWGGLAGNLDASFTGTDGKTYFFKGGDYWSFTNQDMDDGYPKLISEGFEGIPDNLDAALAWSGNGKPYFFKGGEYWRYDKYDDPPVDPSYPASITAWKDLPEDGVDAAFVWENNVSYFFKGGQYYRFDDRTSAVSRCYNPYPVSTAAAWLSCPNSLRR